MKNLVVKHEDPPKCFPTWHLRSSAPQTGLFDSFVISVDLQHHYTYKEVLRSNLNVHDLVMNLYRLQKYK